MATKTKSEMKMSKNMLKGSIIVMDLQRVLIQICSFRLLYRALQWVYSHRFYGVVFGHSKQLFSAEKATEPDVKKTSIKVAFRKVLIT